MTFDMDQEAPSPVRAQLPAAPGEACVHCGTPTESEWTFCGGCGTAVQPAVPVPDNSAPDHLATEQLPAIFSRTIKPEPAQGSAQLLPMEARAAPAPSPEASPATVRPRRSRWPRGRVIATVVLILALIALAGAAGFWQQRTSARLQATRAALAQTRANLSQSRRTLARTTTLLDSTRTDLDAKSSQVADLQGRLAQTRRQLSGARGSLSSAQDRLDLQANQIETLKSCLNGVTSSLTYAAQGDYTSALAALDAVQVSCQSAQSML